MLRVLVASLVSIGAIAYAEVTNTPTHSESGSWPQRIESQTLLEFGQYERSELVLKGEVAEKLFDDMSDVNEKVDHSGSRSRFSKDGRVRCTTYVDGDANCSLWILRNDGSVPSVETWRK